MNHPTSTADEQPVRGHPTTPGLTDQRRRWLRPGAAVVVLTAVAVPALLVAAALATGRTALIGASALVLSGLVCRLALAAAGLLVRRTTFSRVPLDDQLPADVWAGILAVPVATVLASGLAGAGLPCGR